jgi:hypothetical protein
MIGFGFAIPKLAVQRGSLIDFEITCNFETVDEECMVTDDSEIFNVQDE